MNALRLGSLFSGIGGLELGLERALGARTVFQVERDAYCRHVLARHWPDAVRFDDVRTVGAHNLPRVDILCGGFPCQDLSAAGKQAGFGSEDAPTRSGLWFEFRRIIGELQPTWIVGENIAHRWRAWVPVVRRALWDLGYASVPVRVRACDVGARHERARVFVVATGHADAGRLGWIAAAQREGRGFDREGWREADRECAAANAHYRRELQSEGRVAERGGWADHGAAPDAPSERWGAWRPGGLGNAAGRAEHSDGAPADPDGARLEVGQRKRGDAGEQRATAAGGADDGQRKAGISAESRVGGSVYGLSGYVDGPDEVTSAASHESYSGPSLRNVRGDDGTQALFGAPGRHGAIRQAPVLQSDVHGTRGAQGRCDRAGGQAAPVAESADGVRGMRGDGREARSSSPGREPSQRRAEEPSDALRSVSPDVALEPWSTPGKAPGVRPLIASGVGTPWTDDTGKVWSVAQVRTARIHGLGNAVVPACAEAVGRLILEAT